MQSAWVGLIADEFACCDQGVRTCTHRELVDEQLERIGLARAAGARLGEKLTRLSAGDVYAVALRYTNGDPVVEAFLDGVRDAVLTRSAVAS